GDHRAVVHALRGERRVLQVLRAEQAFVAQALEADQQRVAREGREALVRRIAVARRPQWEHLPQTLVRALQEVEEPLRRRAQLTDPVRARERGGMQQDAAPPRPLHSGAEYSDKGRQVRSWKVMAQSTAICPSFPPIDVTSSCSSPSGCSRARPPSPTSP